MYYIIIHLDILKIFVKGKLFLTYFQTYKESVLETLLGGGEKSLPPSILEYKEYNTDTTVKFIVKMAASKMKDAEAKGLHKFFSLQTSMSFGNLLVSFLILSLDLFAQMAIVYR